MLKEVIPNELEVSEYNERHEDIGTDADDWDEFVANVEENGVNQPPTVRTKDDGGYEVVIGQRRVEAAKEAGLEKIEVIVKDWDDGDALQQSISENINRFKKDVSLQDRALALKELGELKYEGEGQPPYSWYTERIGVTRGTICNWFEPLGDDWEDTIIDPTAEEGDAFNVKQIRDLGIRKLRSIRKTTGGGEDGEWLAKKAAEEGMTIGDLADVREYTEKGADLENAVKAVIGELAFADLAIEPEEAEEEEGDYAGPGPEESLETNPNADELLGEEEEEGEDEFSDALDGQDETEETETEEAVLSETDEESEGGWFQQYEPVTEEEKEDLWPQSYWNEDGEGDDETHDGKSTEVTLTFNELSGPLHQAAEDLNADTDELVKIAVKKYLSEGHYI